MNDKEYYTALKKFNMALSNREMIKAVKLNDIIYQHLFSLYSTAPPKERDMLKSELYRHAKFGQELAWRR